MRWCFFEEQAVCPAARREITPAFRGRRRRGRQDLRTRRRISLHLPHLARLRRGVAGTKYDMGGSSGAAPTSYGDEGGVGR